MTSTPQLWRAKRLQHIAGLALQKSNRHPAMSRQADHHFRRYLKLLVAALAAWKQVPLETGGRHPMNETAASS